MTLRDLMTELDEARKEQRAARRRFEAARYVANQREDDVFLEILSGKGIHVLRGDGVVVHLEEGDQHGQVIRFMAGESYWERGLLIRTMSANGRKWNKRPTRVDFDMAQHVELSNDESLRRLIEKTKQDGGTDEVPERE